MINLQYFKFLEQLSWITTKRTNQSHPYFKVLKSPQYDEKINNIIKERINDKNPLLIGRHGAVELRLVSNVFAYNNRSNVFWDSLQFLSNKKAKFWEIDQNYRLKLCQNAGFFPNQPADIQAFTNLYIEGSSEIDILALSTKHEHFIPTIRNNIPLTHLKSIEPWWYDNPWTEALKDKKVLIIYPLKKLIEEQYKKREYLFENKKILPKFDLTVIEAVQTIADSEKKFSNWFEALDFMKEQMNRIYFDVAIIGAGAYGFPLALHAKELGRKGIHFGGPTQLLFGIKGKRWMEWQRYTNLMNDNWVFPEMNDRPKGFDKIENGCYW